MVALVQKIRIKLTGNESSGSAGTGFMWRRSEGRKAACFYFCFLEGNDVSRLKMERGMDWKRAMDFPITVAAAPLKVAQRSECLTPPTLCQFIQRRFA